EDAVGVGNDPVGAGYVAAAQIPIAALRGVAVLQIDDDDGGPRRGKHQGLGPRLEPYVPIVARGHGRTRKYSIRGGSSRRATSLSSTSPHAGQANSRSRASDPVV